MGDMIEIAALPVATLAVVILLYVLIVPQGRDTLLLYIGKLGALWKWGRRLGVRSDIQKTLECSRSRLNGEVHGTLAAPLQIEWARTETPEQFLERGKVVVRLRDAGDRHKNLAVTSLLYVQGGVAPRGKPYLAPQMSRAVDLCVTKFVLAGIRENAALHYLMETVIEPETSVDKGLRTCCAVADKLEDAAFLRAILLPEVAGVGDRLYPQTPTIDHGRELEDFAGFLQNLALRRPGEEDLPLRFHRDLISAHVLLVAKAET